MTTPHPTGGPAPIQIGTDRLQVEIALPGTVYKRTRFDWTGFITQVTLDGMHTFCVPEDYDPNAGTGGIGLCSEFGIEKSIGYADAKPGQAFPKLGIGLLIRPDDAPYNFFRPYEIAKQFPFHIDADSNHVQFVVDPLDCRGYAVRETKTIRVVGKKLEVTYHLENSGSQPIVTHEYCHNFVGIDRHPIGQAYRMIFPYPVTFEPLPAPFSSPEILNVKGYEIRWHATPQGPFYCRPVGYELTSLPQWELTLEPGGAGMREFDDFAPARVALWGTTHVVSAEVFIDINLQPGQSQTWTRTYEFGLLRGEPH